jgi:hypothetical protein
MAMEPVIVPLDILLPSGLDNDSLDEELSSTNFTYINDSKNDSKNTSKNSCKTYLVYDESVEMKTEIDNYNYHLYKNTDYWISAKTIVSSSIKNIKSQNKSQTFFWDYLDILFKNNNDDFNNIQKVIYSTNDVVCEFNNTIAKYIVDNLKINTFKPSGYIFSSTDNNVWDFKIVVTTTKNVYSANRYIDENTIGFY